MKKEETTRIRTRIKPKPGLQYTFHLILTFKSIIERANTSARVCPLCYAE